MPVVTSISRQRKQQSRYSIKVDGEYSFSLSDLDLSNSSLRVGTVLSDSDVSDWQRKSGDSKAFDAALRSLSVRRRSRSELVKYLARKEYDESVINDTLERLTELGLIDDASFAAAWIRDRQLLRPRSIQALRFELIKLGVGRDDIDLALSENSPDEEKTLMDLIERRRRQYPDESKLIAYLGRQGFRYGEIKKALQRLNESEL